MKEHEVELINRLESIWRRKWFILVPTFLLAVLAGAVSYLLPPTWEVEMIIQPAKLFIQTQSGQFTEVLIIDPKQVAMEINQESYDYLIAKELKIDIKKLPKLKAEYLKDTKLVRIAINGKNVEEAKAILQSLSLRLKDNMDKKIRIELSNIDTEIKENEIKMDLSVKEIAILQNKLKIIENREKEILLEMKETRERIRTIEKEQLNALKKVEKSGNESLGLLLYSNEIQQSLKYLDSLNELISLKKMDGEDLDSKRKQNEQYIEVLKNSNKNLEAKKGRFDYTQMVKAPTPSLFPVSPKKKLNVLITAILSFILFTMLALFLEFISPKGATKT